MIGLYANEIQELTERANSGELPGQTEIEAAIAELEANGYSLDQ